MKMYISITAVFKSGKYQPNHDYEDKQTVLASTLTPKCDQAEKWHKNRHGRRAVLSHLYYHTMS